MAFAGPASDDGPKGKEARELIVQGQRAAGDGDFELAVEKYEQSFELEANAVTLWGWAQASRQATGCREAVPLFQRFTKMVEQGSAAYDAAREAIVDCAAEMAEDEDAEDTAFEDDHEDVPPPPEATDPSVDDLDEPPPSERPWHRDPLGGVLVGVGAATMAAGGGVLIAMGVKSTQKQPDYGAHSEQVDEIETLKVAGAVVLGVGGALLIGGVVRWLVVRAKQRRDTALVPMLGPRSAGLGVMGRF